MATAVKTNGPAAKRPKAVRRQFLVTLDMPAGATTEQVRAYVAEAVGSYYTRQAADGPLAGLADTSVRVAAVPAKRAAGK